MEYDYDPPDPETRNVFNGFRNYITRHGAQIPDSFLLRLEEAPFPYQRAINDNAQYTAALQPPNRNNNRSQTVLPVAGASGRSLAPTSLDREKDRKEGIQMEEERDIGGTQGEKMELDKDGDRKKEKEVEQLDKDMDRREGREVEQDRDMDRDMDRLEGIEMEEEKDTGGKEGEKMEQDKDGDGNKEKEVEQDKIIDRMEGLEMEEEKEKDKTEDKVKEKDKDGGRYRGRDNDRDKNKDRDGDGKKYRERGGNDNDMRREGFGVHHSRNWSRSRSRQRDTNRNGDSRRLSGSNTDARRERYCVCLSHNCRWSRRCSWSRSQSRSRSRSRSRRWSRRCSWSRSHSRQREWHSRNNRNRDRDRDRDRDGRRLSGSDGDRRRQQEGATHSRSHSRHRREWHNRNGVARHDLTSPPHLPRVSPCRVDEEGRRNERLSPPPQSLRESERKEVEDLADDPNDSEMKADDILKCYSSDTDSEFSEMYTHPHESLLDKFIQLSKLNALTIAGSASREATDAASTKQAELLAKYNNYFQIEQKLNANLKQSTDSLRSTMKNIKMIQERQLSYTQQHQELQNEYSTLLEKMTPINESWMEIKQRELVLMTALSDNLKSMETADGINEFEKLNAEYQELQLKLVEIKENGLKVNRQLQALREEEKNIANKLIEKIILLNFTDSSLKSEEENLKIRTEQHKSLMGEIQDARMKSETAKKELDCGRQRVV